MTREHDPAELVPDHLADWYAGDLEQARVGYAGHTPSGLPARRTPAPHADADAEPAPAEGGRFLASWYAGDVDAAACAVHDHEDHDGHECRAGTEPAG